MTDYKLVPVEPTPEMLDAATQDGICVDGKPVWKRDVVFQAKWKYQQMLAAAPDMQTKPVLSPRTVDTLSTDSNSKQEQFNAIDMAIASAVQTEPVAWMHDSPGRVDVIHASVKKLLGDSRDAAGDFHRPLDKSEHYTIPLYTTPQPAPDVTKLVEALKAVMEFGCDPKSNRGRWALEKAESALATHRAGSAK